MIVVNTYKKASQEIGSDMKAYLHTLGIKADIFLFNGFCEEYPFANYDLVVTLGGDGTVLFAARGCASLKIPIFPVNLGTFGFIASVQKDEWQERLNDFISGKLQAQERTMIKAELYREGVKRIVCIGLNEVVIGSKFLAQIGKLHVDYNGVSFGTFQSDGIIVSTATGSTAYCAASGGPIIDPSLDAFVLTLINSFSLSSRPLVFNPEGVFNVKVERSRVPEVVLTVDGQIPINLYVDDIVKITRNEDKALLIGCTPGKFYTALKNKLNWAGGNLA